MIKGFCRTNLDGFDCSNIKGFACPPQKGDKVSVRYRGTEATLEVCSITHVTSLNGDPIINVELTGRPRE